MVRKPHGQPVVIVGAGRGGFALLEMFIEDELVEVIAVIDPNRTAAGMQFAQFHEIPTYTNLVEGLQACKEYPECIIYNLTHDDTIAKDVIKVFGDKQVTNGLEAKLFWQIVMKLKRVKEELESSQVQLNAIIYHAMDGIITFNDMGQIQGFNPAAEHIFGYLQADVLGESVQKLMPDLVENGDTEFINRFLQTREEALIGVRGYEVSARRFDGERFPLELSTSEMMLNGHRYFICIARDITERKIVEENTKHAAHHDYLTGLPNRALFIDRLEYAISLAKRNKYKMALLFLDLDGFKQVNDTLGHGYGDLLLKEVARRLQLLVRNSDVLARMGGDEFTFVLNNIESEGNAALVANKVIRALAKPFDLDGQICHIGGSIGISLFPNDSVDSATLLGQADEAMYLAKKHGKNTCKFYTDVLLIQGVSSSV